MRFFNYRTLDELRRDAERRDARHVRFEADAVRATEALGRPARVGSFAVGNSMAIHPMEGCDGTPDGRPDELTWRRYERFARGGAKLVWFEATAVRADGRANPRQLWITRDNAAEFAKVLAMMRRVHRERWGTANDLLIPIQLTHSGRYSVSPREDIPDDDLERLEDDYVAAAGFALDSGFEAVDVKATHGYLVNELLGAKERPGRYGGVLGNRLRFLENVIAKIRGTFGERLIFSLRLGAFDGVPYNRDGAPHPYPVPYPRGFGVNPMNPLEEDLGEVMEAISRLRDRGVQLINISLGCPYTNPHIGRPFDKPDEGNYEQPEHPLSGVDRHFRIAGRLQRAFPDLPMVGTGYSWLQKYCVNAGARNVADGNIRFMGIGRGALAYPDFAQDVLERGELDERRVCKTLTFCTYLMRKKSPTGCPPFDKEVYGPLVKLARTR